MLFSSSYFLIFFMPLLMIIYKLGGMIIRKLGGNDIIYKNAVLLIASILFYAWGEPVFVFVIILSIIANYLFGLAVGASAHKKIILVISLIFNIGILFVMKYLTFVTTVASSLFGSKIIEIALPIGISFYTFQIMSYVFDVYYGNSKSQKNPFYVALYILMFPQLIAGPIVRYNAIEKEITTRVETIEDFENGVIRFVVGLSKKVLIADYLGGIADKVFSMSEYGNVATVTAWVGAIAYTLEIYYDFSGYSDMAIGLGKCMGFHFDENFNYPYISRSITEFWRRWHISLTGWFRDYVYIPMGGNRVNKRRHLFNLFVVWLLTGIWHGAQWTFIVWGLVYFVIQMLEKYTGIDKKLPKIIGHIYTLFIVNLCWVLFKSSTLSDSLHYFAEMFTAKYGLLDEVSIQFLKGSAIVFVVAAIGSVPWIEKLKSYVKGSIYDFAKYAVLSVLLVLSIFVVINGNYSPFIYFNF